MNWEFNSLSLQVCLGFGKLFFGLGWIVEGVFSICDRDPFPFIPISFQVFFYCITKLLAIDLDKVWWRKGITDHLIGTRFPVSLRYISLAVEGKHNGLTEVFI